MLKEVFKYSLELFLILPLVAVSLNKGRQSLLCLVIFLFFFMMNQVLLQLPRQFGYLKIIDGNWNWAGKLYALIGSFIFYLVFKKYFHENNFIRTRQKEGSLKTTLVTSGVVLLLSFLMGLLLFGDAQLNMEALAFQLTMPGFDEEFAFRGIMMGLLTTALNDRFPVARFNLGHPSLWITAVLFGLVHSFQLDQNWLPTFDWFYFSYTFLYGWILGWMVLKSKSILVPAISHNSTNFIGTLTTMIK